MDTRIPFARFWWKRLYQRYKAARSPKTRKKLRRQMLSTLKNLVEFMTEKEKSV